MSGCVFLNSVISDLHVKLDAVEALQRMESTGAMTPYLQDHAPPGTNNGCGRWVSPPCPSLRELSESVMMRAWGELPEPRLMDVTSATSLISTTRTTVFPPRQPLTHPLPPHTEHEPARGGSDSDHTATDCEGRNK